MTPVALTRSVGLVAALVLLAAPQRGGSAVRNAASQNEPVRAELVADVNSIAPGQPFHVGVRLIIETAWYVNWFNPGDTGLAPSVEWQLPEGFTADLLQWPHPQHFAMGPLSIFGYANSVLLTARVTPPPHLPSDGRIALGAGISWVACGESRVIGGATTALELAAGDGAVNEETSPWFEDARRKLPVPNVTWRMIGWYRDARTLVIEMQSADANAPELTDAFFYPYDVGIIDNGSPQTLARLVSGSVAGGYRLTIERNRRFPAKLARLRGVMVSGSGWERAHDAPALSVDIPMLNEPR